MHLRENWKLFWGFMARKRARKKNIRFELKRFLTQERLGGKFCGVRTKGYFQSIETQLKAICSSAVVTSLNGGVWRTIAGPMVPKLKLFVTVCNKG